MKAAKLRKVDDAPRPVAANDGDVLPADLLYDVLLRLPADELCRLRLVCRRWRSLTSDPLFAKAHRSRHPYVLGLNIGSGEVQVLDLSGNIVKTIRLDKRHRYCFSFNAQHDLVCVNVSSGQSCVLNLATGAVIADDLPFPKEHTTQPFRFVLGHVPTTGVYKVLRLSSIKRDGGGGQQVISTGQSCAVITLGCCGDGRSIRWRATPDAPVQLVVLPHVCTIVIRGVAYFLLMMMNGENTYESDSIASFDFDIEEWRPRMIKGPLSSLDPMAKEKLGCNNNLDRKDFMLTRVSDCLVSVYSNRKDCSKDLWFRDDMDDMSSSLWTKRYHAMKAAKLRKRDDGTHPAATNEEVVLPTDVLYDVLLRLSAKDLCRLRLVCRRWRSLTTNPLFVKDHRSRHRHLVALHGTSREIHVLDLSGNILNRVHLGHGFPTSFNTQLDLVCVKVSPGEARVLNPVTGAVIADIAFEHENKQEPLLQPRFVLGHVSTTGEYKVLHLYNIIKQQGGHQVTRQACDVVTPGCDDDDNRRWRAKPDAPGLVAPASFAIAVILGVAYSLLMNGGEPDSIASFDFAVEEWRPRRIQGPLSSLAFGGNVHWSHLLLAGLSNCLVTVHNSFSDFSIDLWFMEDMDSASSLWTKRVYRHEIEMLLWWIVSCVDTD
ncbi:hypothetical protein QOZ80_5AG0398950 [Eleusine coracana subsp. coracana]|nr:hypothetical protein QOZ80_5AG0398950 [Eleusine coracana subsp. coracana]